MEREEGRGALSPYSPGDDPADKILSWIDLPAMNLGGISHIPHLQGSCLLFNILLHHQAGQEATDPWTKSPLEIAIRLGYIFDKVPAGQGVLLSCSVHCPLSGAPRVGRAFGAILPSLHT